MRDTYRYHFLIGRKLVYAGLTSDVDRREDYLRRRFGDEHGYFKVIGGPVELIDGLRWEQRQAQLGRPTRRSRQAQTTETTICN